MLLRQGPVAACSAGGRVRASFVGGRGEVAGEVEEWRWSGLFDSLQKSGGTRSVFNLGLSGTRVENP